MNPVIKLSLIVSLCNFVMLEAQMLRKDAYATVTQLITAAGYPTEKHRVKTSDGYILQMHRIPAGRRTARRSGTNAKGKKAVLLVHGLLGSSGDFVIMGPDRSLGYILADAGYDVWLGNLRGNLYTSHQNLTRSDPAFWDYCFHEHGKYDAPSMIDKVLNVTGLSKVLYIGYSMGTTTFFTMMSQKPTYNDKVVAFVALAPAVYLDNVKPLAELLLKTINVPGTMRARGLMSLNPRPELMDMLVGSMCSVREPQQDMCLRLIYAIVGEDYDQNDWDLSPVIIARFQPASWKQIEHFGKIALTGVFTKWEDGLLGAVKPYNLTRVNVPVTLLYGENDQLTEKNISTSFKHTAKQAVQRTVQRNKVVDKQTGDNWIKSPMNIHSTSQHQSRMANVDAPLTTPATFGDLGGDLEQELEKMQIKQIMRLAKELNSTGMLEAVRPGCDWPKFNHLDFAFAKDVGKLLNKPLVHHINKLFNKYGPP